LFNDYQKLEATFGGKMAAAIALRLSMLAGAPRLGAIPVDPPVGLRRLSRKRPRFAVSLTGAGRLRFRSLADGAQDLDEIEAIEIESVE
jgi:hypothetical protein